MSNARRFIDSYNKIDNSLRNIYNISSHTGFSDMIRRLAEKDYIVKKYEDDLVSYARLRNAIVHKTIDNEVIAEPHDDVTEKMEKIAKLVSTPPLVVDVLNKRTITTLVKTDTVQKLIFLINKFAFSNFPIVDDGKILGVINNKILIRAVCEVLKRNFSLDDYIKTPVVKLLNEPEFLTSYRIFDSKLTISRAISAFAETPRLSAIIITENGTRSEEILTLVTGGDILRLSEIMDNY